MDSMVHEEVERAPMYIYSIVILGHELELESFLQDSWNHISKNRSRAHHFMSFEPLH